METSKIIPLNEFEKRKAEQYEQALKDVHRVQGMQGNWNYDDYMCGMFNGLELALSMLENREPDFRSLKEEGDLKAD